MVLKLRKAQKNKRFGLNMIDYGQKSGDKKQDQSVHQHCTVCTPALYTLCTPALKLTNKRPFAKGLHVCILFATQMQSKCKGKSLAGWRKARIFALQLQFIQCLIKLKIVKL